MDFRGLCVRWAKTIFNTARNNHVQVFEGLEFLALESIPIPKVLGPNLKSH